MENNEKTIKNSVKPIKPKKPKKKINKLNLGATIISAMRK